MAGLSAPVQIVRDAQGVPHITTANLDDLFFAQGYVTAQDRLWQMDVSRRYAAGELAEIFGPKLLEHDIQQRYLQIRNAVERGVATLDPRDRKFFEDYARGINAFIESHRNKLPLEFVILQYQPKPWRVTDSLLVGANMSQMLNTQYDVELSQLETDVSHLLNELFTKKLIEVVPPGTKPPKQTEQTTESR